MKNFYVTLIILLSSFLHGQSQSLITAFPTLNAGGYINAIIEDSTSNKVYIAGNFTSVNGTARKNIARLSHNPATNTYSLDSWNAVTAMTGEILCMAKYNNQVYIGGNYTSINGNGAFQYFSKINNGPTSGTLDATFDPDQNGNIFAINDLVIDNNLLYIAGTNTIWDAGADYRTGFAVYDLTTQQISSFDPYASLPSMNWASLEIVKIHINSSRVYLCGKSFGGGLNDGIVALNKSNLSLITSFNPSFTFEMVIDAESYQNKLYIINSKIWPFGEGILEIDETNGNIIGGNFAITGSGTPYCLDRYKNYLFIGGDYNSFQGQAQSFLGEVNLNSTTAPFPSMNFLPAPNAAINTRYGLKRIRNRLYVSDNNLSNISSTSRNGIAAYCLEPLNTNSLITSSSQVCPGQNVNYISANIPYANGYYWWYTGNDITLTGNLSNSISIQFGENATSGNLYMSPYSFCNLYSDTLIFPITVNPRPDANAGIDTALNCSRFWVNLSGNSTTSPVSYLWNGPSFVSTNQNPTVNDAGTYILTVTNTTTGCTQKDTMIVALDTIRPNVTLPTGPFILTCNDTIVSLVGTSTTQNASLYWNKVGGGIYANPYNCDSIGQYYLVATDTRNTCKDSAYILVNENRISPNVDLISHTGIASLSKDTLTCIRDTILCIGGSSTTNTVFEWENQNMSISTNDSIYITVSDAYLLYTIDTTNGCKSSYPFFIAEFKTAPQLTMPIGNLSINCSADSVILNANSSSPQNTISWMDSLSSIGGNPITVNQSGWYFAEVIRGDNGCKNLDSVFVDLLPLILLETTNDTLICSGSDVLLNVNALGNFSSLNYQWSHNLPNAAQVLFSTSQNEMVYISVSDGNGCIGEDSILVSVPPTMQDSILTFASCDSTGGQIQIFMSGGIPPYLYSIDNGNNFQSNSIINVSSFGNYTILVRDSLNCEYFTSATVNSSSQAPLPDFMVATNSYLNDTLVLVNISNPFPDSVVWNFPNGTIVLDENIFYAQIILPDTGDFILGLQGYTLGCAGDIWKNVHVSSEDTTVANFQNENGIRILTLYPNPNDGHFTYEIELYKKQDVLVQIYDLDGNIHYTLQLLETDYINQQVSIPHLPNGTYLLRALAEFDVEHYYFTIAQ